MKKEITEQQKQHVIFAAEIAVVFVLIMIVKVGLIWPLWDGDYLEFVINSYKKGPIVQTKMVDVSVGCDRYSMSGAGFGEGDFSFEVVGQGYWWGNQAGCYCSNSGRAGIEISRF